jgi:membrane-bound serine protease (ClpP class)
VAYATPDHKEFDPTLIESLRSMAVPHLRGFSLLLVLAGALGLAGTLVAPAGAATPRVLVAVFDNDVNPVTQDYLQEQVRRAERGDYAALVVELDTPGGLGSSMRKIVQTFLAAKVPVIVWVAPSGASADSAGAVIGQAADVLAMAPQTNIGSSTPISTSGEDLSDDLRRKVVNDAAAYIAELAREHGRNAQAAEAMVREAANFGAREAVARNIADLISPSLPDLLQQVDGRVTKPKGLTLQTAGAQVERVEMSAWKKALDLLIDPNLIALMLSLGVVGILVELWNPGLIFPGTVGAISLIVGLYGLQVLPVSVAGALLLLLSFAFFAAEAFVPSHGAITIAGAIMFVIGALMLFDPAGPAYQVSLWTAVGIAATLTLLLGIALTRVVRVRRAPVQVGVQHLVGGAGEVKRGGLVSVNGELWRARRADGGPLQPGEHVVVESVEEDLELVVGSVHSNERD